MSEAATTSAPAVGKPKGEAKAPKPAPTSVRIENAYGTHAAGADPKKGERWITGMVKGPGLSSNGLRSFRLADSYNPDLSKVKGSDVTLNLNEASYVTGILTMQTL